MHISLVKKEKVLTLYVNGIKDNSLTLTDSEQNNKGNLYIGGTLWLKDQCNFPFLMDEVRYYDRAVTGFNTIRSRAIFRRNRT